MKRRRRACGPFWRRRFTAVCCRNRSFGPGGPRAALRILALGAAVSTGQRAGPVHRPTWRRGFTAVVAAKGWRSVAAEAGPGEFGEQGCGALGGEATFAAHPVATRRFGKADDADGQEPAIIAVE